MSPTIHPSLLLVKNTDRKLVPGAAPGLTGPVQIPVVKCQMTPSAPSKPTAHASAGLLRSTKTALKVTPALITASDHAPPFKRAMTPALPTAKPARAPA